MKKLSYLLFLISTHVFSQQKAIIEGLVLDKKTAQPIPFANAFLEGTTWGTQTDSLGNFTIRNIPIGKYRLVISMIGYQTIIQPLAILKSTHLPPISLIEDTKLLEEVQIVGVKDSEWEKNYKIFEKAFLGEDFNRKEVSILNREVIDFWFDREKKALKAKANQPILVENKTLGYRLNYLLQDFELDNKTVSYRGLTHFQFLPSTNEKEIAYWNSNKLKAYNGSMNHFLKAFLNNNLTNEGFEAYYLNTNYVNITGKAPLFYDMSNSRHLPINMLEFVSNSSQSTWRDISIKYPIEIINTKKRVYKPIFSDAPFAYSILIQKDRTLVNENGFIDNPYAFEVKGDMGKQGIAALLPNNYSDNEQTGGSSDVAKTTKSQQYIYLHTNKEHYRNKESIWLKGYLIDNQTKQLINSPQKIFIELFSLTDLQKPLIQQIYKTNEVSFAYGSIHLPELPSGTYLLRAYSNAMRNDPTNASVFEKSIYVENPKSEYSLVEVKTQNTPDRLQMQDSSRTDTIPKLLLYKKGKERFSLSLLNSIGGEFSMSVSEENSEILTMSDYFSTNAQKKIEWASSYTEKTNLPAYEPLRIGGKLLDEKKKIIPNVSIMAVALNNTQQPISAKTDSEGIFSFDTIEFEDSTTFLLKVTNRRRKEVLANIEWKNSIKTYFPPKERDIERKYSSISSYKTEIETEKDKKNFSEQILEEVSIKAKKDINGDYDEHGNPYWKIYGKPDGVIKVDRNSAGRNLIELIQGRIPGLVIKQNFEGVYDYTFRGINAIREFNNPPLMLLDGVVYEAPKDDSSPLLQIPAHEIDKIEYLVNDATSLFGARAAGGIIAIFTKRGTTSHKTINTLGSIKLKGFDKFADFEIQENSPDFWKPSFQLLPSEEYEFEIPKRKNAKRTLIIQGITYDGQVLFLREVLP